MSAQVWKCKYCTLVSTEFDLVEGHESECSFNPTNRKCQSCVSYQEVSRYDYNYTCVRAMEIKEIKSLQENGIWDWYDMEDSKLPCPLWESSDE